MNHFSKLRTHITGLDKLFFDGIVLNKPTIADHKGLTIVIRGATGAYKTFLAIQMLVGLYRSMKELNFFNNPAIQFGNPHFYTTTKRASVIEDQLLDMFLSQNEANVIREGMVDDTKWKGNEFCSSFFKVSDNANYSNYNLDEQVVKGLLYYSPRTDSLNIKKWGRDEKDIIAFKRKYDTLSEYIKDEDIPPILKQNFLEINFCSLKRFILSKYLKRDQYIPCQIIEGVDTFHSEEMHNSSVKHISGLKNNPPKWVRNIKKKACITIFVVNEKTNIKCLNPDIVIETRLFTNPATKYIYHQLCISKSVLQPVALGWHQYKKRMTGIEVFPSTHLLMQKRRYLPSYYRHTYSDILEQTFSQYLSDKSGNTIDLFKKYVDEAEQRAIDNLKTLYEYSRNSDPVRTVFGKILLNKKTGAAEKESYVTGIIGKVNSYKRLLASAGTFYESKVNNGLTLKILLDKESRYIFRRMLCPALIDVDENILNGSSCSNSQLTKCRECYRNIHMMDLRMGCTTSDEFFYNLINQLDSTFQGGKKITRIVLDDLQHIEYSFPVIKEDSLFLTALIGICRSRNIDLCLLCDESSVYASQLRFLADNVLYTKRTDKNELQVYIERYSGHNSPNLIYGCRVRNMDKLFRCSFNQHKNELELNDLLVEKIDNIKELFSNAFNE